MSTLEAVRDYLRLLPGLEDLSLDVLDLEHGAVCLRPAAVEPVQRAYLDGSVLRQELFDLWAQIGRASGRERV